MVQVNNASKLEANKSIEQHFEVCTEAEKHARLLAILRRLQSPTSGSQQRDGADEYAAMLAAQKTAAAGEAAESVHRVIIFANSKRGCEYLRTDLKRRGFAAEALHGDKSQQERDWALQQFKLGTARLLIATDVAGRGLDVKDVRAVVNYDAPQQAEDYVHRIGRAGRAGATGESYTLLTPSDAAFAAEVARMFRTAGTPLPRELLPYVRGGGDAGGGNRRWK